MLAWFLAALFAVALALMVFVFVGVVYTAATGGFHHETPPGCERRVRIIGKVPMIRYVCPEEPQYTG